MNNSMDRQVWAMVVQEAGRVVSGLLSLRTPKLKDEPRSAPQVSAPQVYEEPEDISQEIAPVEEASEDEKIQQGVACIPCVPPDTLILTNPSVREINEISIGDRVIDANGDYTEVINVTSRPYRGEIISLIVSHQNEPINLTPDHPVFAIKGKGCRRDWSQTLCYPKDKPACLDCSIRHIYKPEFMAAAELKDSVTPHSWMRSILLMPRLTVTKERKYLNISDYLDIKVDELGDKIFPKARQDGYRPKTALGLKDKIIINSSFLKLIGYYLAEGSVIEQKRGYLCRFDFGIHEDHYVNDVAMLIRDVFGVNSKISKRVSTLRVEVSSKILGNFLVNLCGKYASGKFIPPWILTLPKNKQAALLKGYWNGDGSSVVFKERLHLTSCTVSKQLAYSLRILLYRLGIINGLYKYKTRFSKIDGRIIKGGRMMYHIHVNGTSALKLAKILNYPIKAKTNFVQSQESGIDENWIYLPVKKVKREFYIGDVMNLETLSGTYCANGIIVHNCTNSHLLTCRGLLDEAHRMSHDGLTTDSMERVDQCLGEIAAAERIDLAPANIAKLPTDEQEIARHAAKEMRNIRHDLEGLSDPRVLESAAARTTELQKHVSKEYVKVRLSKMGPAARAEFDKRLREKIDQVDKELVESKNQEE